MTLQAAHADSQFFELGDSDLESGITLPGARIAFVTHGHLNLDHSNAILLPSWYGQRHHGYDFLIGPDKALDPGEYYLVAAEMFASSGSSSPSNTPSPFDGPRFPLIAIRDNVEAGHRLLTERLGITHLKAIIGFSVGAQQAFQWAVSHPDFADLVVGYCGTAKTYPHGVVRLESAISALKADAAFNNGDYTSPPSKGIVAWQHHWMAWIYSQEWWRRELYRPQYATAEEKLQASAQNLPSWDPNDLISQAITWQRHNVGDTVGFNGDQERALESIRARVLYMPCQTDLYFPISDAEYERQFIRQAQFVPIPSIWGHVAGAGGNPEDNAFLNTEIRRALR